MCSQHLLCARHSAGCCKPVRHSPLVKEFTGPVEETQATELLSGVIDAVRVVRKHRCALPTRVQEVFPEATCVWCGDEWQGWGCRVNLAGELQCVLIGKRR